jgi:hypothetical protein
MLFHLILTRLHYKIIQFNGLLTLQARDKLIQDANSFAGNHC